MIGVVGIAMIIWGWMIGVGAGLNTATENPNGKFFVGIATSLCCQASGIYLLFHWLNQ